MPPAAGDYTLTGLAVPEGLDALHDLHERIGVEHPPVSPADLMLFETAVIEIADNVVEHGRPPGEVHWTFTLAVHDDPLEARLSDDGVPFAGATTCRTPRCRTHWQLVRNLT